MTESTDPVEENQSDVVKSQAALDEPVVPETQIFRSRLDGITYVFPNGKTVMFKDRKYETDDVREINHLQDEISKGHPSFYSGDPEMVVDAKSGVVLQGVIEENGDDVVVEDTTEDPPRIHDVDGVGIKSTNPISEQDTKQSNS